MSYFNDSPIESSDDDSFGITEFSKTLANGIAEVSDPVGTVIALHGPWGSGKSSAVNLVVKNLEDEYQHIRIINFTCWWYRGEEALALAFLQNLNSAFTKEFGDKVKEFVPKVAKSILQAGPVIASAMSFAATGNLWSVLTKTSMNFANSFFPDGDSLEETYKKLSDFLSKQDKRFLVIIDDIDRLSPEEAMAVFRIVKSVGRLPNVQYLLVFDRALAEKNATEMFPSEGPHFLEKIVQVAFELPSPLRLDLNNSVLGTISQICGPIDDRDLNHLMNLFYDIIAPSIETPRDIARYRSILSLTWPAVEQDVCIGDYAAIEMLRLKHPSLHSNIRDNKDFLCGRDSDYALDDKLISSHLLNGIDDKHLEFAKLCYDRLFPNWKSRTYAGGYEQRWTQSKMICSNKHFDTYFRLSISDDNMGGELLEKMIEKSDDKGFIQSIFREAATNRRKDGTSYVPVYLDEMSTHANRLTKKQVIEFLQALYEIYDDINLDVDKAKGFMGIVNTGRRYLWLTYSLLSNKFTINERSKLFLEMSGTFPIGWLTEFARSSLAQYEGDENETKKSREELVTEECADTLGRMTLAKIVEFSDSEEMISHSDLGSLLHMWYRLDDSEPKKVKAWTQKQMNSDLSTLILAKTFTGESWGHGQGIDGLDDRVSMWEFRVDIQSVSAYVDLTKLKKRVEDILERTDNAEEMTGAGENFLEGMRNSQENPF